LAPAQLPVGIERRHVLRPVHKEHMDEDRLAPDDAPGVGRQRSDPDRTNHREVARFRAVEPLPTLAMDSVVKSVMLAV
jgi:hypothetical protein